MKTSNGIFDQEISLIHNNAKNQPRVNPIASCLTFKLLPILAFILLSIFHVEDGLIATITAILSTLEFIFIKYVSGYQLVGLKWFIQITSFSFSWESKPEPYVPKISNSNFFWMSFFTSMVFWVISFFVTLYTSTIFKSLCSCFCFISEIANLYMFSKAYSLCKKNTEKAVLASIQDNVHFEYVPEEEKADAEIPKDNYYLSSTPTPSKPNEKKFSNTISDKTTVELPPTLPQVKKQETEVVKQPSDNQENEVQNDDFY